ncbi:hypothetical protein EON65_19445 [archaeon]|nr:MAG: hypothetical protein EON65_19445 [archaeon]
MATRGEDQEDLMLVEGDEVIHSGELALDVSDEVEEGNSSGVKGVETNESSRLDTTKVDFIESNIKRLCSFCM